MEAFALLNEGLLHILRGHYPAALASLNQAWSLAQDASPAQKAHLLTERARAWFGLGQWRRALGDALASIHHLLEHPAFVDWVELGRVYLLLSAMMSAAGNPVLAARLAEQATVWLQARGRSPDAAAVRVAPASSSLAARADFLEKAVSTARWLESLLRDTTEQDIHAVSFARRFAQNASHTGPLLDGSVDVTVLQHAAFAAQRDVRDIPLGGSLQEAVARTLASRAGRDCI